MREENFDHELFRSFQFDDYRELAEKLGLLPLFDLKHRDNPEDQAQVAVDALLKQYGFTVERYDSGR